VLFATTIKGKFYSVSDCIPSQKALTAQVHVDRILVALSGAFDLMPAAACAGQGQSR
jgi:hypothetical protein